MKNLGEVIFAIAYWSPRSCEGFCPEDFCPECAYAYGLAMRKFDRYSVYQWRKP